ncbi:MAG: hypothetical protein Q8922_12155 [Bacteroidota bacterium]|nr:hypothetical protein [Bacteroidota bacterium]MDP4233732.1 hypothetical protein [Bacteroidota bacterium]MDP4242371.1 hypothetical protein [Bacteroidota bacterium]MDP4288676.1 hypothetical protein [Bacteroidota bacterium]
MSKNITNYKLRIANRRNDDTIRHSSFFIRHLLLVFLVMAMGGGCMYTISGNPDVSLLTVTMSPSRATVPINGILDLTADIRGVSHSAAITWTIIKSPGGDSVVGTGLSAQYHAANFISLADTIIVVRASSVEDPTRYAECTIVMTTSPDAPFTISPIAVTMLTNRMQQFEIDTIQSGSIPALTWSIVSGPGTITNSGLYTAPASIERDSSITLIQAASATDTSLATITLLKSTDSLRCFSRDIQPIMQSCTGSGCHDGSSRPLLDYRRTLSDVKPGNARASRLYQRIVDFNMNSRMPPPPAPALTPNQVLMIGQWIDQGAMECQ